MDRDPDRAAMILQAALNRLADPHRAVRGELEALPPIELLDRADEAEHALLHQVVHGKTMALVPARLSDDEPKVRIDHPLLGLEVATLDPLRQLDLLRCRQQRVDASLPQEN